MTNQSELEQFIRKHTFADFAPGGDGSNVVMVDPGVLADYITAHYTPINQPSTNTATVTDDNPDKPSANELHHMLINHMQNMLTNPQPVDVDYGAHLLDRLLGEREQEAYKRGYKARQAPEVETRSNIKSNPDEVSWLK